MKRQQTQKIPPYAFTLHNVYIPFFQRHEHDAKMDEKENPNILQSEHHIPFQSFEPSSSSFQSFEASNLISTFASVQISNDHNKDHRDHNDQNCGDHDHYNTSQLPEYHSVYVNDTDTKDNQIIATTITPLTRFKPLQQHHNNLQETVIDPVKFNYQDDNKVTHECIVSLTRNDDHTIMCFWHHHPIPQGKKIQCPISYIPPQVKKTYVSETSRYAYAINEYVTPKRLQKIKNHHDAVIPTAHGKIMVKSGGCYYTYGAFCSPNCCYAFILDKKNDPFFARSATLLPQMISDITGQSLQKILPAPSPLCLNVYGGHLSNNDYMESFGKQQYESHGISLEPLGLKVQPPMGCITLSPIGFLYQENLCLSE